MTSKLPWRFDEVEGWIVGGIKSSGWVATVSKAKWCTDNPWYVTVTILDHGEWHWFAPGPSDADPSADVAKSAAERYLAERGELTRLRMAAAEARAEVEAALGYAGDSLEPHGIVNVRRALRRALAHLGDSP